VLHSLCCLLDVSLTGHAWSQLELHCATPERGVMVGGCAVAAPVVVWVLSAPVVSISCKAGIQHCYLQSHCFAYTQAMSGVVVPVTAVKYGGSCL
jgi:hypothetical protein